MRPETEAALEPLLLDPSGPSVAAIGGGHGQASALEAIQTYAGSVSALVSVADNGGSSGRLTDLGIPPPGDIRRCLLALTPEPSLWSELFAHRFDGGDVSDHSLGNLILAALCDLFGDFDTAVKTAERMLGTLGSVIPVTDTPVTLEATIDGVDVRGQAEIGATDGDITDLRIDPSDAMATREALSSVAGADQIVIGPGSLYTSVLSALMVQMLGPAVMDADAKRVFVLNLVTQRGETSGMTGYEHIAALEKHVGVTGPGTIVCNTGTIDLPDGVEAVTISASEAAEFSWDVVFEDVSADQAHWPEHDPLKLARALESLS